VSEVSRDLIEMVAPHLSPPVKRVVGGVSADSGDGADVSQGAILILILAFAEDGE